MFSKSFILSFAGSLLLTFSVCAGTSVLEGVAKDPSGRPIKGADVRIEGQNFSKVVKTDARGHYTCDNLGVGAYKVTLLVGGQVKASTANARTQSGKAAQVNFNVAAQTAPGKKKTHMVYVRADVDTHIGGGGRWIEVDENGIPVGGNTGAGSNVQTITGTKVQETKIGTKAGGGD
jgi:Carboxypeptidase regulatory-like domain